MERWSRWHLRREVGEGTRYTGEQASICAGVMAGLDEPQKTGRVVDLSAWRRRVVALPWKPAVGFAAAASMGAAAVLFLAPQQHRADFEGGASDGAASSVRVSNPLGNTLSLPGTRAMGRLQSVSLTGDNNSGTTFADEEYAALLRDYVASRNAAAYGDVGNQRYARFDSAEATPRQ